MFKLVGALGIEPRYPVLQTGAMTNFAILPSNKMVEVTRFELAKIRVANAVLSLISFTPI
jgi:hypothetical protein